MLSVKDLLRHATWNRSNDDFSGEFVLLVDCYSSHQHIDATSRYALNRDYDTRAYARSVEACNQLEGQR